MAPLIVLVAAFLIFLGLGRVGVKAFEGWHTAARFAFAAMFLLTASAHFASQRQDLIRMVPPVFPRPDLIVTVTGILEILGAIGLMVPRTWRAAAWCLALLLVAMFPANVYAALHGLTLMGKPVTALPARTALQIFYVAGLVMVAWRPRLGKITA
jgi:uncharacterized membrane protein